jgi:hypothetical protein
VVDRSEETDLWRFIRIPLSILKELRYELIIIANPIYWSWDGYVSSTCTLNIPPLYTDSSGP